MDHQSSANFENLISSQPLEPEKPSYQSEEENIDEVVHLTSIYSEYLDKKSESDSQNCERNNEEEIGVKEMDSGGLDNVSSGESVALDIEKSGRERLKRHRVEMAGRVWIPDLWGHEEFLKDWIDCAPFDAPLVMSRIMTARAALVEQGRRPNTGGLRNRC